jgi:tetratricopeptide (TPR) repeat protein
VAFLQPTMLKISVVCLLLQTFFMMPFAKAKALYPGKVNTPYTNKARALYKEGLLRKKSGQLNAAQQYFIAAIRQDSTFTPAHLQLGNVYLLMENLPAAKEQFLQVMQQTPEDQQALSALASIFFEQQGYEDALCYAAHVSSVEMDQLKGLCYAKLGHHYYTTGNYGIAITYWNKLYALQPANLFACFMLGKSYIGNGETAKGEALCDKAFIE